MFARTCGTGTDSCHSARAYVADPALDCRGKISFVDRPLGAINPRNGEPTGCPDLDLYARLTELTAVQCFLYGTAENGNMPLEAPYIVPGDLDRSYIWSKIDFTAPICDFPAGTSSQHMPIDGAFGYADRDTLSSWITSGALRCPPP
jgi:hypothetical protein